MELITCIYPPDKAHDDYAQRIACTSKRLRDSQGLNLKKNDLIKAIAEVHNAEFIKRLQRAQKTGRHSAIWGDVENPHKKGPRDRELVQIKDEVDAALWANKYTAAVEKKPLLWQKPMTQITGRLVKPHLHGLTRSRKETLAQAIKREGADILKDFLDPDFLDPDFLDPKYYALYDRDTPVLHPDAAYVHTGAEFESKASVIWAVSIFRWRDLKTLNEEFDLRLVARGPDITDEGQVYWVSFEGEDLRVTKDMASEIIELLSPNEHYSLFTAMGKAAKEPLATVLEEEGASDHRIMGKTIVNGDQVSAGALHGIDQQMWEKGREYLVYVRYELRPVPILKDEPGPMLAPEEDSEFVNCFV